ADPWSFMTKSGHPFTITAQKVTTTVKNKKVPLTEKRIQNCFDCCREPRLKRSGTAIYRLFAR
ncbi:MAG: hypothetical protein WBB95_14000, partial [Pseudomonas sp.]|uniref:hypothetical protein n=1 Tax=Pseudomonas sp. TaxID=306 RepID=UPI003C720473